MQRDTLENLATTVGLFQRCAIDIQNDTQSVLSSGNHLEIIRHFNDLRLVNEQIKEARKALQEIEDSLSTQHIPEALRSQGVKTITVIGVGRVTVSHRFTCSILDKQMGHNWLRENGHGDLIQPTVNSSTLAAFAKDLLQNQGKELPNDIFKTGTSPYTSITKAA